MTIVIGSQYTGRPAAHADSRTGVYWEALPKIEGGALTLQRGLLTPAPRNTLMRRLFARKPFPIMVGTSKSAHVN